MLKTPSDNGTFILTKSSNWYLTLEYHEHKCVYIVNTVVKSCKDKKSVKQANEIDHLVQTVSEWVSRMSHHSGAS